MEPATSRSPSIASEAPDRAPPATLWRPWLACGALAGLAAVALKAYLGHGGAALAETPRGWLETAGDFALYHAAVLLAVAILARLGPGRSRLLVAAGAFFSVGLLCFSGGLTARALLAWHALGPLVPLGGTALLIAWSLLLLYALRRRF
ncbi:MAG: DUF423 domain-containing protein [Kiloniellales bacterium]